MPVTPIVRLTGNRPEFVLEPEECRALPGREVERSLGAHPRLGHPDLPVRPDAVVLSVGADGSRAALVHDVLETLGEQREAVVGLGTQRPPARVRDQHPPGQPALLLRIVPVGGLLPEVLLVPDGGPADHEGDRVDGLRAPEEPGRVLVERDVGERVLPAGLTVKDEAHVVDQAASLAGEHELPLARDLGDPLPLVAARLHVGLDRGGAP